jgi:uncharacterized peroxidase-related enzyme
MGRVTYLSKDQAAESIRPTYDDIEKKLGVMLNFFKAMAHNPGMLQGFLALDSSLGRFKLDRKLRELAYLKASDLNACGYCLHYHRALGKKVGLSEQQINDLARYETSDAYDDRQREVLRYAEQVTRNIRADDALVGRLKEFLSDQELVELTMTVGLANLTNRMNEALKIDLP